MKITILTLFPEMILPTLTTSILKRAKEKGLVEYEIINLRDFGQGLHQVVDGRPYGGGAGMVLKADVLAKAVTEGLGFRVEGREVNKKKSKPYTLNPRPYIILTSAAGHPYTQAKARELSQKDHILVICGHYEGVDQRFIDHYVDEEISIGDYVLTGGELPALVITDSIVRLIKGVLKKEDATIDESFTENLLEYPHYTRPEEFEGLKVPAILQSGHHQEITNWRKAQAIVKTKKVRPELLKDSVK